jgi:hypothetical protein
MDPYKKNPEEVKGRRDFRRIAEGTPSGRVLGGIVIVVVGLVLFLDRAMEVDIPRWVTSFPMLLIAVGLFIGARHNFRSWGWLIPIGIGFIFLSEDLFWEFNIRARNVWPIILVIVGLVMIFRPKRRKSVDTAFPQTPATSHGPDQGEILDTVAIFGSAKKNILSKNFRGGDVISFFGGSDLNFMQADIQGVAVLDVTSVFGGAKMVVPASWTIKSELVSIFGGIEDKRQMLSEADPNKVLVLEGTVIFGGIEIKSY